MDGDLDQTQTRSTTSRGRTGRWLASLTLAATLVGGLGACGSSGGSDAASDPGTTTSAEARTTTTARATTTTAAAGDGASATCTIDYGSMAWSGTDKELVASNEEAQADCSKLFDKYMGAAFGGIALPALLGEDIASSSGEARPAELRRLHAEGFQTLTITVRGKGCDDVAGGGSIEYVVVSDPAKPTPFTETRLRKGVASLQPGGTFTPTDGGVVATLPVKAGDTTCPVAWAIKGRSGALVIAPSNDLAATTAKRLVG